MRNTSLSGWLWCIPVTNSSQSREGCPWADYVNNGSDDLIPLSLFLLILNSMSSLSQVNFLDMWMFFYDTLLNRFVFCCLKHMYWRELFEKLHAGIAYNLYYLFMSYVWKLCHWWVAFVYSKSYKELQNDSCEQTNALRQLLSVQHLGQRCAGHVPRKFILSKVLHTSCLLFSKYYFHCLSLHLFQP